MAALRSRRFLRCFYCGKRSNFQYQSQELFHCSSCDATNFLDKVRGRVALHPFAPTPLRPYASTFLRSYAPTLLLCARHVNKEYRMARLQTPLRQRKVSIAAMFDMLLPDCLCPLDHPPPWARSPTMYPKIPYFAQIACGTNRC